MGHEIGYHYEVLDRRAGNPSGRAGFLIRELAEMRALVEVKTASMHGNPLSRWDNRDLWKHHALSRFGLIGEAYVSINGSGDCLCYGHGARMESAFPQPAGSICVRFGGLHAVLFQHVGADPGP